MIRITKAAAAVLFALGLLATGCSTSGSDAKVATTAAEVPPTTKAPTTTSTIVEAQPLGIPTTEASTTEVPTTAGPASDPSVQAYYDNVLAKIEAIDTSDFCTGVTGIGAVFKALFDFPTDADGASFPDTDAFEAKLKVKLTELEKQLGRSLPQELRADWDLFVTISDKASEDRTPAEKAAADRLAAYAKTTCHINTN